VTLSPNGREWIVEALGCMPEHLCDEPRLRVMCEELVRDLDLHVVGEPQWHRFGGHAGVTGLYLLSESHLAVHTYPEFSALSLNLYSCRDQAAWPFEERIKQALQAREVRVRSLERSLR